MKSYFLILLMAIMTQTSLAQSTATDGHFGFALNSGFNGEVYPFRLTPSITYTKGLSQFEAGFGFHPNIRKDQKILSGELNYKIFPNGQAQKFNFYVLGQLMYLHNKRATYYPTTYNYLFLNAGYGFDLALFKGAYMGTNMSIGTFTYAKTSAVPYAAFATENLFESFGFNLAFQFNVGYRF
jgi:hypothetical protein